MNHVNPHPGRHLLISLILCGSLAINAQTLDLDSCQARAKANYPLARQYGLIDRSASLSLAVAEKAFLPQLSLSAKATYQSAVTEIPENLETVLGQLSGQPVHFNAMPKDQYQATVELQQLIWDGGAVNATRKATLASSEAERRQLDTEMYTLRERINTLYFGVLLLDEQKKQLQLLQKELEANKDKLKAYLANGVALPGDLDALEVEVISIDQQVRELNHNRATYLQWLCAFTGTPYTENIRLNTPVMPPYMADSSNNRPELAQFEAMEAQVAAQRSNLSASTKPQFGLFVQGGVGRPGLNLFSDTFEPFYIGGLRLSWQLGRLYTYKDNQRKLELNQQKLDAQRATFLLNNDLEVTKIKHEVAQLTTSLNDDERIVALRRRIKEASEAKFTNGTLTYSDYLRDINAEHQALQRQALHRIQQQQAVYRLLHCLNQTHSNQ